MTLDEQWVVESLSPGRELHEFGRAWDLQRRIHAEVVAGDRPNTLIVVEHEAVFTAGRSTQPSDRPQPTVATPVIDVDRGGRITWHGPGQLVAYPIARLAEPLDVVRYVRWLEQVVIDTLRTWSVEGMRVPGRSGVWVSDPSTPTPAKVSAVGVRVARGATLHGLALNVDCDTNWQHEIVPCGISDARVTTLAAAIDADPQAADVTAPEAGRPTVTRPTVEQVAEVLVGQVKSLPLPGAMA